LVAIKHESFYEAIDLPHFLPMPVIFAKAELLRIPVWGLAARRYGLVAVERDKGAKALRAMVAAARDAAATGRPLAIFPEGTRVPHGQRPELQAGFAGLYKLLGLPVVPVAVDSGPLYHRWWKRPGTVTIQYGEIIPPGLPRDEIEARVHSAINALNEPGA
jgi:1-acyl-sn-glycerol-3-phosphate acyltransferase